MKIIKSILFYTVAFILVPMVFWISWEMANTTINLNESTITTDKIVNVSYGKGLLLETSKQNNKFWIYRMSGDYQDFLEVLNSDDEVKIYHDDKVGSNGAYTLYQLEKSGQILIDKTEYERKEQFAGKYIGIPGSILMLLVLVWNFKKKMSVNTSQSAKSTI